MLFFRSFLRFLASITFVAVVLLLFFSILQQYISPFFLPFSRLFFLPSSCVCSRFQVRTMSGHSARVGTLAWKRHVLSSGSRDSSIIQHDVRMPNHKMATFTGHEQEVSWTCNARRRVVLVFRGNSRVRCSVVGASFVLRSCCVD